MFVTIVGSYLIVEHCISKPTAGSQAQPVLGCLVTTILCTLLYTLHTSGRIQTRNEISRKPVRTFLKLVLPQIMFMILILYFPTKNTHLCLLFIASLTAGVLLGRFPQPTPLQVICTVLPAPVLFSWTATTPVL